MSTKSIRFIAALMVLTLLALFGTQMYWFKKSFNLHETQFDENVNISLRTVAHQLRMLDGDSTSTIPPIFKSASNEFFVITNCYFRLAALDSSLKSEFAKRNLNIDYTYFILESQSAEIVLGNTVFKNTPLTPTAPTEIACKTRADNLQNVDFKITIHNKTAYLLNSMGIWIYSSFTLIFILVVFTFILFSMIKGKKLASLKSDFVNNMTHEFKTPIANIAVASSAIKNRNATMDDEKLKKYADIIYHENNRLLTLVDKVLQISSIEKTNESFAFENINLHEIIEKAIENFNPLLQKNNGQIICNLQANMAMLKADWVHLTNVFYNLIDNAIKYSSNPPEITINTWNNNKFIGIEITDKGIGMSEETQNRIFEKFFRAETGNLHNTKGYGIGLSYVKLVVEKHHGKISIKSMLEKGTTFTILLPQ